MIHDHRELHDRDVASSVVSRFAQLVDAGPDRVAISTAGQCLTYGDLHRASNRVANAILARHGDDEAPAIVLAKPGATAITLLLGALKAGKFYVPLDPTSYPRARLTAILGEVGPAPILTATDYHADAVAIATSAGQIIDSDRLADVSDESPHLKVSPERLGYLFYTSGSTGRPKGVLQTQRNIVQQIATYSNALGIRPTDRLTLLHSHAFSASRLDIFGALLNGATVCPFSVNDSGLPALVRWLADEEITVSHWVPTLFRYLGKALDENASFPTMRVVVLGSEPMVPGDLALYRRHFSDECVLVNRFGATESGNICMAFFDRSTEVPSTTVPVGHPVSGVDVFVSNENGTPVETGVAGEICVRSKSLSPGYWKNPELTRTVFDTDASGTRVYRSGDLGRLRPDGMLEHLGRKDSQVKVRGFRVETQEIEALLSTHPDIEETIVDALVDEQGETRLVAYAVPVQGRSIGAARIRGFLSDVLPHYMVPSSVVTVDAFPRTPSGKVDRRALGAMRREGAPARPAPPSIDPTERRLIGIWAQILGLLAITATDNFFELGGNSLMAAQMMLLIQRTFGRQLPPSALFRAPTVHQLAEMLRTDQHEDTSVPSLVSIQPEGSLTPFFWIHGDRSNAYLPEFLGDDRPLYGLMHQGLDGLPVAHTRVETIAAHYVRQMQTVQPAGPYLLGGYSFGGTVAFEIAQQLRAQGHDVPLLAMLDSLYPGDDAHLTALDERTSISGASAGASISRHSRFDTLAQLGFRERLTYLRAGATARLTAMIARPGVKRAIVATCLRLKRRLPAFVRSFYILGIYRAALASYAPKPYAGRVVYFKSSSRSHAHQEKWRAVVPGGLEAYEVPGEHTTIIRHENARPWAERLRKCVAETVASCAFL